jgi:hypothetical protein
MYFYDVLNTGSGVPYGIMVPQRVTTRSGLVSSSQIAGQDGVPIALRTMMLGRGILGETQG